MEGIFILNYFFSFYLIFSPFVVLQLRPSKNISLNIEYFDSFIKIFSRVLLIVNISAIIYAVFVLWKAEYPDDVFTGLYGKSGFGSHSLSIINLAVSVYYFQIKRKKTFIFFFISGVLGFYGLGLLMFLITIVVLNIPYLLKKVKIVLSGVLIFVSIVWVIYLTNPQNIDYILLNFKDVSRVFTTYRYEDEMEKVKNYDRTFVPRYFTFIDGTRRLLFSDAKVFLLGTSPGGYNSRTAFYLNGDFIQKDFVKNHFSENTQYHEEYVLPILNRKLLEAQRWNDGTRNQPFSSIISIFLEYGILIGGLYLFLFYFKARKIIKNTEKQNQKGFLKFLLIFLGFLLTVQNYMEYPEIIIFFILCFKLMDVDNAKRPLSYKEIKR